MSCDADQVIHLKTGSSGTFVMQVTDEDGEGNDVPKDLSEYEIYIDFVSPISNEVLFAASIGEGITLLEETGRYTVNVGTLFNWPIGLMPLDILYVYRGISRHTNDWALNISEGRSRGTLQHD